MKPPVLATLLALALAGCAGLTSPHVPDAPGGAGSDQAQAINHYLAAVIHEELGQFDEALEELRKAADLSPHSIALQIRLLGAYYMSRDYESAAVMAERAIKREPENVILHMWLGRIYYQLQELDKATETFNRAIAIAPEKSMGYEALVQVEEETNDLVGALELYEKLVLIEPESPLLHYRLGLNLARIDDGDGARAALEKAIDLNPGLSPASYLLGVLYLEAGECSRAIELITAFLQENPRHVEARVNLSGAYVQLGRYDAADRILKGIIEGGLGESEHLLERMFLLLIKGGITDASQAVVPNGAPILGTLIQALVRKQAGEPFLPIIESLDTLEGSLDDECNLYLNTILSLFGQDESAIILQGLLEGLISEGSNTKVVGTVLARTLMLLDRDQQAETVLTQTLQDFGPDKWLHYYLATVSESLNHFEEAEKHLRACLEFDPNDPDTMNFLGYLYAEEDMKLNEALDLLERALQLDPGNGFYLDSMGWIYYRKGDAKKAIDLIKRAIRAMDTDDAILRDHLGDAYFLGGDLEKALPEWKRAQRLDPELEGLDEKIRKHTQ